MPPRSAIELTKTVLARSFPDADEAAIDRAAHALIGWSAEGVIERIDSDLTHQHLIREFEDVLGTSSQFTSASRDLAPEGVPDDVPWRQHWDRRQNRRGRGEGSAPAS